MKEEISLQRRLIEYVLFAFLGLALGPLTLYIAPTSLSFPLQMIFSIGICLVTYFPVRFIVERLSNKLEKK